MPDPPVHAGLDTIRRAHHIAVRDLRACYNPDGIVAGRLHFTRTGRATASLPRLGRWPWGTSTR